MTIIVHLCVACTDGIFLIPSGLIVSLESRFNKLVQDMKVHLSVRMMCLAWRTGIKLSHIQFFPSCPSLRNVILGE